MNTFEQEMEKLRHKEWKKNQLDRIEKTVNETKNIVGAIAFFGFLILLAIWFSIVYQ